MTSAADIEIWHAATQAYDNGQLQEAVSQFSSMSTISSKIYFNIGIVFLTQQKNKGALENFQEAVKKDAHFAVGYYMSGICNCKESRYPVAIEQFQQALKCMRGNKVVDYKQLGLKYQLYECEVLMNQAFAYSKQGEVEKARDSLTMAIQVKVEKKHECASEALQLLQAGKQLELILPPSNAIFRPSAQAVKNLKKKDYLGQAKVLYTADPTDNTPGFSGLKLVQEQRQELMSDICQPNRKKTLRRVSAPARPNGEILPVGKVLANRPPQKALPPAPQLQARQRKQTWAGVMEKPMPMSQLPEAPKRPPPSSPSIPKRPEGSSWNGQKSKNSAFMENGISQPPRFQAPKKPLPTGPFQSKNEYNNNEETCPVNLEVQFSFSVKLQCSETTTIDELKELILKQSVPKKLDLFYVDSLGKQKKLSQASFNHIVQGTIDNAKIICFEATP